MLRNFSATSRAERFKEVGRHEMQHAFLRDYGVYFSVKNEEAWLGLEQKGTTILICIVQRQDINFLHITVSTP